MQGKRRRHGQRRPLVVLRLGQQPVQLGLQEDRIDVAVDDVRVAQHPADELDVRPDAEHDEACERRPGAREGGGPGVGMRDDLGEERVVVGRDDAAGHDTRVDPDARADRFLVAQERARVRQEVVGRVLGVHSALNRVAAHRDLVLRPGERPPRRDRELGMHEVPAGHRFGDGVLHLQACVHLQEGERGVVVAVAGTLDQELDRAGVPVPGGPRRLHGRRGEPLAQAGPSGGAPGFPRSPSGDGAEWSTRARTGV